MEGLEDKEKKEEERRERIRKILPEVFMYSCRILKAISQRKFLVSRMVGGQDRLVR